MRILGYAFLSTPKTVVINIFHSENVTTKFPTPKKKAPDRNLNPIKGLATPRRYHTLFVPVYVKIGKSFLDKFSCSKIRASGFEQEDWSRKNIVPDNWFRVHVTN